jgi:hypothetical protein
MLNAGTLTFQEFVMKETVPLTTIHDAVLTFLRGRDDVVLFGAHAVNAYVSEPRMTQDIDLLAIRAEELTKELQSYLRKRFHIAIRVRKVKQGRGYRLYQVQKSGNRHLVDVRPVGTLPVARRIAEILVIEPAELIASKVIAYHQRRGKPKSGTDWRDIAMLLLAFPDLKSSSGPVLERLRAADADATVFTVWQEFVTQEIRPVDSDDDV